MPPSRARQSGLPWASSWSSCPCLQASAGSLPATVRRPSSRRLRRRWSEFRRRAATLHLTTVLTTTVTTVAFRATPPTRPLAADLAWLLRLPAPGSVVVIGSRLLSSTAKRTIVRWTVTNTGAAQRNKNQEVRPNRTHPCVSQGAALPQTANSNCLASCCPPALLALRDPDAELETPCRSRRTRRLPRSRSPSHRGYPPDRATGT